ncbi:MAG: hypothetical protein HY055_01645 [Magnetospirillum sp.]|nr:hypothetical protein [Magnetospirillum sp.]
MPADDLTQPSADEPEHPHPLIEMAVVGSDDAPAPAPFQDLLDPEQTALCLLELLPIIGDILNLEIQLLEESVWDVALKSAASLAEMSADQDKLRQEVDEYSDDPTFPGRIAWSKQVATLVYYLLRFRPIIRAWPIQRGPLNDEGVTITTRQQYEDTSANERICLFLAYLMLADGVKSGNVWRLFDDPKTCWNHCDAFGCFLVRYWKTLYGDGTGHPTNLAFILNILKCEGLSKGAISIIVDHILYGACILAPPVDCACRKAE